VQFVACAIIFGLATTAAAHQPVDGDIHGSLGWLTYMTHPLKHPYSSAPVLGPGLTVEGDLNRHGGIEVSMFYLNNVFSVRQRGETVAERVKRMYISTGYRHWFTSRFSLAGAISSSYTMGDPRVIHNDFAPEPAPLTSARETVAYGIDTSMVYEVWRQGRTAFVVDGRYNYSLTAKRGENANHFGVMVAIKYFLQARTRVPE